MMAKIWAMQMRVNQSHAQRLLVLLRWRIKWPTKRSRKKMRKYWNMYQDQRQQGRPHTHLLLPSKSTQQFNDPFLRTDDAEVAICSKGRRGREGDWSTLGKNICFGKIDLYAYLLPNLEEGSTSNLNVARCICSVFFELALTAKGVLLKYGVPDKVKWLMG